MSLDDFGPPTRSFAAAGAFALLALAAAPGRATTYLVDRFTEATLGVCSTSPNDCALRGAILAANGHAGDDVVLLTLPGTYTLSLAGGTDLFADGFECGFVTAWSPAAP